MTLVELDEVIALQDHVVEFQERERLLALEAQPDAVHRQHAVDGEMPADIAQERDVLELSQPIVVVHHDRACGTASELEVVLENLADARNVRLDLRFGEQLPRLIPAGWIAHLGGASAHEHDRPMPGALQVPQQHDGHQVSDVQAVGGGVIPDVGRHHAAARRRVEGSGVGLLVNEAALVQRA